MDGGALMQIGEVAERTCLSLRTIRYYEEVGLVVPSARSQGRFRLYTEADVRRLWLIRRLKPLGLSLDQIRELVAALDRAAEGDVGAEEAARLPRRAAPPRSCAAAARAGPGPPAGARSRLPPGAPGGRLCPPRGLAPRGPPRAEPRGRAAALARPAEGEGGAGGPARLRWP